MAYFSQVLAPEILLQLHVSEPSLCPIQASSPPKEQGL